MQPVVPQAPGRTGGPPSPSSLSIAQGFVALHWPAAPNGTHSNGACQLFGLNLCLKQRVPLLEFVEHMLPPCT